MPKVKRHKGLLKRVRITKSGKVRHRGAGYKHLRSHKSARRLRRLRTDVYASNPEAKRFEKLLFRRLRGRTQPASAARRNPSPEEKQAAREQAKADQQSQGSKD